MQELPTSPTQSHRKNTFAAGLFLRDTLPYYPPDCIHIVVVDPGVGSDRNLLLIKWQDSVLLAPDNGCWTLVEDFYNFKVFKLNLDEFSSVKISNTFHGRDILAPIAGRIWQGNWPITQTVSRWNRLDFPYPESTNKPYTITGEVLTVDRYGNLITNICGANVPEHYLVVIEEQIIGRMDRRYADGQHHQTIALISSSGYLEIAVVNGSAAQTLNLGPGAKVIVRPA